MPFPFPVYFGGIFNGEEGGEVGGREGDGEFALLVRDLYKCI